MQGTAASAARAVDAHDAEKARIGCLSKGAATAPASEDTKISADSSHFKPEIGKSVKVRAAHVAQIPRNHLLPGDPEGHRCAVCCWALRGGLRAYSQTSAVAVCRPPRRPPHSTAHSEPGPRVLQKRQSVHGATASEDRSTEGIEVWEEADPCSFSVRGVNYAKDGKKFKSKGAIYRRGPLVFQGLGVLSPAYTTPGRVP